MKPSAHQLILSEPFVKLDKTPHVPFGSKVLGHIPLDKQTKLGGRSFPAYAVGPAPNIKEALLLYNIYSRRVVIRRKFSVLGPFAPEFGSTTDHVNTTDHGKEDLVYDPVYHKMISSQSEEFNNTIPKNRGRENPDSE